VTSVVIITQKVGLITADEVAMAGGVDSVDNINYYLYQPVSFYTMSPAEYYNYNAYVFYVSATGSLLRTNPTDYLAIRPVINIISSATFKGDGTITNPYTLEN